MTGQGNLFMLRGFDMPRYYNGVIKPNSNAIYGEFTTEQYQARQRSPKGAVGLYYGNSSPSSVANYITKTPQFVNRVDLLLAGGSYNCQEGPRGHLGSRWLRTVSSGIASSSSATQRDARVNNQHSDTLFIAPSFSFIPSKWIRLDAEYNGTKFSKPYGSLNTWNATINPEYYKDLTNPSQQILNYMKASYGLADDAAARAKIAERWASPRWTTFLNNWSADIFGMTGVEPFLHDLAAPPIGASLSPQGDLLEWRASSEANQDGFSNLADVGVTLTPYEGLAVKYRWLHAETKQNFVRLLYLPNGGLTADGRVPTMSATGTVGHGQRQPARVPLTPQRLDASYEFNVSARCRTPWLAVSNPGATSRNSAAPQSTPRSRAAAPTSTTTPSPSLIPHYPPSSPAPR